MNTKFAYQYRDASNYKQGGAEIFVGTLSAEDKLELDKLLGGNGGFIPSQVGLEDLQPMMISFPSEDDHVWHEAYPVEDTTEEATTTRTAQQFFESVKTVQWNVVDACELLGLLE